MTDPGFAHRSGGKDAMPKITYSMPAAACALVTLVALMAAAMPAAGQQPGAGERRLIIDLSHAERVTYRGAGAPNLHTADNAQRQDVDRWADGLAAHGFAIETAATSPFTPNGLDGVSVVAVLQPDLVGPDRPARFGDSEIAALRDWLQAGGTLVAVADPLITTSGATFLSEGFSGIGAYRSGEIVNNLLSRLGLGTHVNADVVCSTRPEDKPSGTDDGGLNAIYGSELPEGAVALDVETHGLFTDPGQRLGHFVGHTIEGAQLDLAGMSLDAEREPEAPPVVGGVVPVPPPDAEGEAWTVLRSAAEKKGDDGKAASCGAERDRVEGAVAGVTLDRVGKGKVVTGGDLSLHVASYGSATFYDNENFGMKPFWESLLPAIAGPGPRRNTGGDPPGSGSPSGDPGSGGSGSGNGPVSGSAPGDAEANTGGSTRRGGRRGGETGSGRGEARSSPGRNDGRAVGGALERGRSGARRAGDATPSAERSGSSAVVTGAGPARESASEREGGEARPLSTAAEGGSGASGASGSPSSLREVPDVPALVTAPTPGWLTGAVGGGILAALAGGFGLTRRRLRTALP